MIPYNNIGETKTSLVNYMGHVSSGKLNNSVNLVGLVCHQEMKHSRTNAESRSVLGPRNRANLKGFEK